MQARRFSDRPRTLRLTGLIGLGLLITPLAAPCQAAAPPVTLSTLLEEMRDLSSITRWPEPAYRTIQLSSYDRRSTHPEAPHWYANSDGFGREPVPGFAATIREPGPDGVGCWLLADLEGPGAIVRGWSAAMDGRLRVWIDGHEDPVWDGKGYDFFARRSEAWLDAAGVDVDAGDAFVQQDADYLPLPFARKLRIEWEGHLDRLHFYQLQVRLYEAGAKVETRGPVADLRAAAADVKETVERLTKPVPAITTATEYPVLETIRPGATWRGEYTGTASGGVITELRWKLTKGDPWRGLRGLLLRIRFDGAHRPQVECPLGDFHATGPGAHPISSLPITIESDGTLVCRFPMPFRETATVELTSYLDQEVRVTGQVSVAPWVWDDRSLHFRAKWRVDPDLLAAGGDGARDMPYVVARGQGLLVGAATMVVNPCPVPTSYGNWWGEGDEKIFVDDEPTPSTFGTGTEDYYNYSWSRADLFDHPYCGQPLDTGPANAGYVSNHRFQIVDAIPFRRSLAFYMELWHHTPTPDVSYARIAYHYARPGCLDDHRPLGRADLVVDDLPRWEPVARAGAAGAVFHHLEDRPVVASAGSVERMACDLASRGRVTAWAARRGERLTIPFEVRDAGVHEIRLIALHRPDAGALRAILDDTPLLAGDPSGVVSLRIAHGTRLLNVFFRNRVLTAGSHSLRLECVEPGLIGADYMWLRNTGVKVKGAMEAEELKVVAHSPDLVWEAQGWSGRVLSAGRHLWVQPKSVGEWIEIEVPVARPGVHDVRLWLTQSWDYGRIRFRVDGKEVGKEFDAFSGPSGGVRVKGGWKLGELSLGPKMRLRIEVTGHDPKNREPHLYFGLDCLTLTRRGD